MASHPTITNSVQVSIAATGPTISLPNITIVAAATGRKVRIACLDKYTVSPMGTVSEIVFDAAGVNAKLSTGQIVLVGAKQSAAEGIYGNVCEVYEILDANLPALAGSYTVDTTITVTPNYHHWVCHDLAGAADAHGALVGVSDIADVLAGVAFSYNITTLAANSLVVDYFALSHSSAPILTLPTPPHLTVEFMAHAGGSGICAKTEVNTASLLSVSHTVSTLHQRRAGMLTEVKSLGGGGTYNITGNISYPIGIAASLMSYVSAISTYSIIANLTLTLNVAASSMVYASAGPSAYLINGNITYPIGIAASSMVYAPVGPSAHSISGNISYPIGIAASSMTYVPVINAYLINGSIAYPINIAASLIAYNYVPPVSASINDNILFVTGGPTVNDGLLTFYKARGATSNVLVDAEIEFLIARGISYSSRTDMWNAFLSGIASITLSGTLSDMKASWWANSAPLI